MTPVVTVFTASWAATKPKHATKKTTIVFIVTETHRERSGSTAQ